MSETSSRKVTAYTRFAQIVVGVMGIYHSLTGVALIFFPLWFFQHMACQCFSVTRHVSIQPKLSERSHFHE